MYSTQKLSRATPETIRHELLDTVKHLLRVIRRKQDILDQVEQISDLLESLPLAAGDYGTATNRLRNAHRYLRSEERGAARYELQLLAGSLRATREPPVRRMRGRRSKVAK